MKRIEQLPPLPDRSQNSHKGSFGSVFLIGGSRGMSGAMALAGMGALRGGAGLVTLAVPMGILSTITALEPSYLTKPLPEDKHGCISLVAWSALHDADKRFDVVAIGPGLCRTDDSQELTARLFERCSVPLVVDADGLNNLTDRKTVLSTHPKSASAARVLTPHPGEFARLLDVPVSEVQANREQLAAAFAAKHQLIVVLKGHGTIITDGEQIAVNPTGNPGMATGGMGDVLTGLIAALLGQGMAAFDAAHLGVYLHGLAADIAVQEFSQPGLIASDLPLYIGPAWQTVLGQTPE
ncbi:NAD(P)H-hydrate dehydratase [Thalassoroseus pseudoceratinae]|uniref:NAD(P)H-hydrate dehydratase n=1 Tax=Thalassoroseus pseudoceratinae TaxID=2713176 RepID=UPI0014238003|nr:NAD(P)H-hydrate dehydratase [Thalassoroseus pseudoceratinae]